MPTVQLTHASGPVAGVPELAQRCERLGYEALWIGEVNDYDAVVAATLAATSTRDLVIGALLNVFTRAPTNAALAAASLAHVAPRRVAVILGASSPLLVERWNGIAHERPHARVRDYLRFLRDALSGHRVSREYATFRSSGFSLSDPPAAPPTILVAAAMPRSIALACGEADGVVLNWLAPADLDLLGCLRCDRSRVWLSVIVCPSPHRAELERVVRPLMTDYLSVPAYAGLQRLVGRGSALEPMWERFAAGDRGGARAQLPGAVIDELVVSGTAEQCGERLRSIESDHGVHAIASVYLPDGVSYDELLARMSRTEH